MRERVKVFTYIGGKGATLIEPSLEDHLNEWLASLTGRVLFVTQSESRSEGNQHHVTVCVWYEAQTPGEGG